MGQEEIKSPFGHLIKIYDKERTICDCIINIDQIGRNIVLNAIKEYMYNTQERDIDKLYKYADKLKIKEKVKIYVEVLYEI